MKGIESTAETEVLWREFHERLRAFVSRRVLGTADVEDILQEIFLRVHRGLIDVRTRERLPAWIFQIARNVIVDHYRSSRRFENVSPALVDEIEQIELNEGDMQFAELSNCLVLMIGALEPIYRDAIEQTDIAGLSQVQAAQKSGVSISGMKSRVQRGRRELKRMLLECCRIELDRRGGIIDYKVRDEAKSSCSPCDSECRKC